MIQVNNLNGHIIHFFIFFLIFEIIISTERNIPD